jgi:CDP-diacylglycerol--glycerol-3-phosphate 3-phosphatidyltransferase
MLNRYARGFFTRLFSPLAHLLLRLRISPDAVTAVGTAGVVLGALVFYPQGQLFWGTIFITFFVFSDLVDGIMARLQERTSTWGGFLDSTLDRLADGAVFAGLTIWFFTRGNNDAVAVAALACLLGGMLVSYARAKAESLGFTANTGIAERAERLVLTLTFTGLTGLGLPPAVLLVVLVLLAAGSFVTVVQRMRTVYLQARN